MNPKLHALFEQLRNKKVIYVPNPGNAGDALIACATLQRLKEYEIKYTLGNVTTTYENEIILYGGGGNLVEPYPNAINFIELNQQIAEKIIVLPHTILSYEQRLSKIPNLTLFCREYESFQYCRNIKPQGVFYADDMAFTLDIQKLDLYDFNSKINRFFQEKNFTVRALKRIIRKLKYKSRNWRTPETLNAFRLDVEKTNKVIPPNNIDVSQVFSPLALSSEYCIIDSTSSMLAFIDNFKIVNTNRLHVAISALLLNKQVNFYDNSYGKNYFVYKASIENKFQKIKFFRN